MFKTTVNKHLPWIILFETKLFSKELDYVLGVSLVLGVKKSGPQDLRGKKAAP